MTRDHAYQQQARCEEEIMEEKDFECDGNCKTCCEKYDCDQSDFYGVDG